jgi:phage terminase small subunit
VSSRSIPVGSTRKLTTTLEIRIYTLTARQKLFALEYPIDLNGTQAAIRAGYSARTAEAAASRLLRNVKVGAEIRRVMDERGKRLEISADNVLRELAKLAFSNIDDFLVIHEDGHRPF